MWEDLKLFFSPAKADQYEPFLPTGTRNAPAQCAGAGDAADSSCAVGRAQKSDCVQDSPPWPWPCSNDKHKHVNVNVFYQPLVFKSESISNKKGIVISVCLGGGGRKKWLRCDFLIFTKRNKNRLKNKVFQLKKSQKTFHRYWSQFSVQFA